MFLVTVLFHKRMKTFAVFWFGLIDVASVEYTKQYRNDATIIYCYSYKQCRSSMNQYQDKDIESIYGYTVSDLFFFMIQEYWDNVDK